jgi:hypothetical protein
MRGEEGEEQSEEGEEGSGKESEEGGGREEGRKRERGGRREEGQHTLGRRLCISYSLVDDLIECSPYAAGQRVVGNVIYFFFFGSRGA